MRNKSLKYIFGILLSSVLLTVGCGSSSSNNPVSTGSVNSGLVSVSGNVKNADGNGTVSFYTPTAIYGSNQTNTIARAVVNNDVYTFNIDENGNYAGQIPAGDYYIIAQNSDGSMKYASARQSISMDTAVSEGSTNSILPVNIELVPTTSVKGTFSCELESSDSSSSTGGTQPVQYVYLENMPFVTEVGENGYFEFESVPVSSSYRVCSDIWIENYRYHFVKETTSTTGITLDTFEPISISGKNVKLQLNNTSDDPSDSIPVIALLTQNNDIYSTISGESGEFYLPIDSLDDLSYLIVGNKAIKKEDIGSDGIINVNIRTTN